jgi:signal transduction histidine kinase
MVLSKDEFLYLIFIIAAAILMLLLFFIVVLILNVRIRKQKEIEKLNAVITTQEDERKRIAEDLHDEIGPMLSAIKLQINNFTIDRDELDKSVKETSAHLDAVIQNIRGVVRNLSPSKLHSQGLIQSIEEFRTIIEKSNKIRFKLYHENINKSWNEQAEASVYRIIHELINNSIKHSNCSEINIALRVYEKVCLILYVDNGSARLNGNSKEHGSGLQNIQTRVAMMKGKLNTHRDFTDGAFYEIKIDNKNLFQSS